DLCLSDARDAINRRSQFRETQVELGCLHRGLSRRDLSFGGDDCVFCRLDRRTRRLDLGLSGEIALDRIIEFLICDRLLPGERGVAIYTETSFSPIRIL